MQDFVQFINKNSPIFNGVGIAFIFLVLIFAFLIGLKTSWRGSIVIAISLWIGLFVGILICSLVSTPVIELIKTSLKKSPKTADYAKYADSFKAIEIWLYPFFALFFSFWFFIFGTIGSVIWNRIAKRKRAGLPASKGWVFRIISGFGLTLAFIPSAGLFANTMVISSKNSKPLANFVNVTTKVATYGKGLPLYSIIDLMVDLAESTDDSKSEEDMENTRQQESNNPSAKSENGNQTIEETYPTLVNKKPLFKNLVLAKKILDKDIDDKIIESIIEPITGPAINLIKEQAKTDQITNENLDKAIEELEKLNSEGTAELNNELAKKPEVKEAIEFVKYEILQGNENAKEKVQYVVSKITDEFAKQNENLDKEKINKIKDLMFDFILG